ncbi:hypothetical protein BM1_01429 [Bipolaris maydis]|nr:hypothetical protein BM1_01429 [Bipolaris maydis]
MALAKAGINLAGRVFSVTGGASGMGFATAALLAQHSAKAIWIADRQTKLFDTVRTKLSAINPSVAVHLDDVDVSNSSQVDKWVDSIIAQDGVLHGAANIAGLPQFALRGESSMPWLLQETDEKWRQVHSVNSDGIMYCTRAQFRVMYKNPESNPSIVNLTSMAALLHVGGAYAYSTSKAAAEHFTRSSAADGKRFGIRVNGVLPGPVKTPMMKQFFGASIEDAQKALDQEGLPGAVEPEDVAQSIVWLLSENASQVNGVSLPVAMSPP